MLTKEDFTRRVLESVNETVWDLESALRLWWQDERDSGGMRLSGTGHQYFQQAGIESWEFMIGSTVPARPLTLLTLKQHMTMPYFLNIGKKFSIIFYSSRDATMYSLYGDIDRFVRALKNSG